MRVLLLCPGADTGGSAARTAAAFRRLRPGWEVRAVRASSNYIGYAGDLEWNAVDVASMYAAADVVQIHNQPAVYRTLDGGLRKPVVFYHHGTALRTAPRRMTALGEAVGATQACSTIDLLADCPPAVWAPIPIDIEALEAIRRSEYQPGRRLRIVHAPTNRAVKSTDYILGVLERLAVEYPIDVDLIEHVPWTECLRRKARADIVIDQLALGYGANAAEAWAMGIPVVVGFADPADVARATALWGGMPFDNTTAPDLETSLRRLLESPAERSAAAERGREHVCRWHADEAIVEQRAAMWAAAKPSNGSAALDHWQAPSEAPVGRVVPEPPMLPRLRVGPFPGTLPRMRTRRGRAGYGKAQPTYDPAHPGLVLE